MRRFIAYLKKRMEVQQVESETPPTFLAHLQAQVAIDGALPILPLMLQIPHVTSGVIVDMQVKCQCGRGRPFSVSEQLTRRDLFAMQIWTNWE